MLTAALRLIEYRTEDGSVFRLEVSADVAEALRDHGSPLRESVFADVTIQGEDGEVCPLDPDQLDPSTARRRVEQRPMPTGNPWEGPRFTFSLYLGEHRPGWNGGICIDERGRCGLCHDQRLPHFVYCLGCDRSGRDAAIPTAGERTKRRAPRDGRLKGGLGGKVRRRRRAG